MRKTIAIALAALAFAACKPRAGAGPAINRNAIKALGSAVPEPEFDRGYWLKQHDANTPEWREAKRLCGETVLANYPNCIPVNDFVEADRKKKAKEGNEAAAKIEAMGRRGYGYDYRRRVWLLDREMLGAGCSSVPAYPNNPRRIGFYTWQCPSGVTIPKGIPDPAFSKEEEDATD